MVTGAGGFIGSHLTERLVELGADARALVHYRSDNSWGCLEASDLKSKIEVVLGDVRDGDCVRRSMQGMQIVFHLAALIGIPYSYDAPLSYVRTNIEGTLNILQAAHDLGVERVVHTSTSEVYGTASFVPINEGHSLKGQSPYSASKIGADKMAEAFHLAFDLPVVTVRPFNAFGPRQSARAVIPTIIMQCLMGDIVCLGSLEPTRDLNFVTNIVDGFVKAASVPEAVGKTINLGSGREISIGELAQLIGSLMGKHIVVRTDPARLRPEPSEVQRLLADNTLARTILRWAPEVSLEQGLRLTIQWMERNIERYRPGVYVT